MSSDRWTWVGTRRGDLFLALAAILPFLAGLGNEFAFDDTGLILDNPTVWSSSPAAAWTSRYWPESEHAGLYRPLTTFSYWVDGKIWGTNALGFLLFNLFVHVGVTLLAGRLLRAVFPGRMGLAWVTTLVFAVHPLHSEAITGIVGRAESLAAFWALLALVCSVRSVHKAGDIGLAMISAGALGLAMLAKESATGLFLLPVVELFSARESDAKSRWRRIVIAWGGVIGIVLLLRIGVLGSLFALGEIGRIDNPLAHVSHFERVTTALGVQTWSLIQLIAPWRLSADYSYPQIVPTFGWAILGGIGFALVTLLALVAIRTKDRALLWPLTLVIATATLTSNLLFPIGTVYGERLTYLPSLGMIWILVLLASRAFRRIDPGSPHPSRLAVGILSVWILLLAVRSEVRCFDWRNNTTLFEATVQSSPNSAKARTNLALSYLKELRLEDALEAASESQALYPDYPANRIALGSILNQLGRPNEAADLLSRNDGLRGKRRIDAALELGNAYLLLGEGARAESTFHSASSLIGRDDIRWVVGVASAFAVQSRWPEARTAWQNAVELTPEDPAVRRRFAYSLWQSGEHEQSEQEYRRLLSEGGDPSLWNDVAWFLVSTDRDPEEAVELAKRAFGEDPSANVADTVLEALLAAHGCPEGRKWMEELRAEGASKDILATVNEKLDERCPNDK